MFELEVQRGTKRINFTKVNKSNKFRIKILIFMNFCVVIIKFSWYSH